MRPEPASNGRDDFRGPEFCSRRPGVLSRRRGGQSPLDFINQHMPHYCMGSHFCNRFQYIWLLHVLSRDVEPSCFAILPVL